MDDDGDFEGPAEAAPRCPEGCPNAGAPYCPAHEDPAIYRRDETKLHLAEAYANNAARDMVVRAVEAQREKRHLKEVRVPGRVMDEWVVFTKQVVLDSGEYTGEGEIGRRVAAWLDKAREQDWERLDRIKERYMRFTTGEDGKPVQVEANRAPAGREPTPLLKRPKKRDTAYGDPEDLIDDEM